MTENRASAVILAAGKGARLGGRSKAGLALGNRPMLAYSLDALRASPEIAQVVVVMNPEDEGVFKKEWGNGPLDMGADIVVAGGEKRWMSCREGVSASDPELEMVLVHDAARPLLSPELVHRVWTATLEHEAAFAANPVPDSLHFTENGRVTFEGIDRENLWAAQTPQGALRGILVEALEDAEKAAKIGNPPTDEVSMLQGVGVRPVAVPSPHPNPKVTWPADLDLAQALLAGQAATWSSRIGHGGDSHRLVEGSPCMVGGVPLECGLRADAHSDGDAILHALTDAILGGAGEDDLGTLFPDTDPRWKGADSKVFLDEALKRAADRGLRPASADIVVSCDRPRIGPHREEIRESLAGMLGLSPSHVNIKGKTTEGLDLPWIEASAVVLLRDA